MQPISMQTPGVGSVIRIIICHQTSDKHNNIIIIRTSGVVIVGIIYVTVGCAGADGGSVTHFQLYSVLSLARGWPGHTWVVWP